MKILLVEDEDAVREMTALALERAGFAVAQAADVSEAEEALAGLLPDLILLDWMLPGVSGIELGRRLRRDEHTRELPIILLTARVEEDDKLRGFDLGIDDYITKPFSPRELIARVKAVLRRTAPQSGEERPLAVDSLRLDPKSHRVSVGDTPLHIGPTEFRLLYFFMSHPERVFSRGQLLDRVWGRNVYIEERTVDVHIRRLRKTLAEQGYDWLIQTVRSAGYRFSPKG